MAVPALLLAAIGLTHPYELTPDVARHWVLIHIVMLPLFPLLAVTLLVLLRHDHGPLSWLARIAAYGYAVFYSVLDVLTGIGAGSLVQATGRVDRPVGLIADVGRGFGQIGELLFIAAALLTTVVLWRRVGTSVLPGGVLLVLAGVLFAHDHVHAPWGVLAQVAIALGTVWMAFTTSRRPASPPRADTFPLPSSHSHNAGS